MPAQGELYRPNMDTVKSYINGGGDSDAGDSSVSTDLTTPTETTGSGSQSNTRGNNHRSKPPPVPVSVPVAICGMAMRLPGGVSSAEGFWDFLVNKGDACARIPASRYATHGPQGNSNPSPASDPSSSSIAPNDTTKDQHEGTDDAHTGINGFAAAPAPDKPHWRTHGYMLNHVDLAAFDASLFSMTRAELGVVDPQQRLLLELTRYSNFTILNGTPFSFSLTGVLIKKQGVLRKCRRERLEGQGYRCVHRVVW